MSGLAGKTGRVYGSQLLVEDCEDTWNEHTEVGVTLSTITGKTGNAVRATTATVGANTLLMSEVISKDLTAYDAIIMWIRSSVATASGDLQLLLDDTAEVATPLETLNIPALTANTWRMVTLRLSTPSALGTLISIGLKQVTDLADGTFDIDSVYALQEIDGMKNWSIDYTMNPFDDTDFQSDGIGEVVPGITQWSGSFDGNKDGAPLSISNNTPVYMTFGESKTDTQTWMGQVLISGVSASTSFDGLVTYSYTFTGTEELQTATT